MKLSFPRLLMGIAAHLREGLPFFLLGTAGLYRSFSFVYSTAERSVWVVLNLAGKGEKRSAFSVVWVPPWFNAPL